MSSATKWWITATRGHAKMLSICSSSNTTKTVDERAARACRTKVAIGTHKPRWTHHHQVHQSPRVHPRFPTATKVFRVTEVDRCTQQGESPCTDAIAKLSVVSRRLIYTITNMAMDSLVLVIKLVELNFSSRGGVASGPLTLTEAPTLRTRGIHR